MEKCANDIPASRPWAWAAETVLLGLGLAVGLAVPLAVGLGGLTWRDFAAVLAVATLAAGSGRSLAVALRLPIGSSFGRAFEIVGGFAVLGLLLLGLISLMNVRAATALALAAGLVLPAVAWAAGRAAAAPAKADGAGTRWADVAVLAAIVLLATLWSRQSLVSVRKMETTGQFRIWCDISAHATEVNYLRNYPEFERRSPFMAGRPQLFYHRASYTFAAAFGGLSGRSNLQAATCFWTPLGLLLMGIGAWGLGSALAGRGGGALAAGALLLLPDASTYGLANGIFSFHWAIEVGAALAYGIAIVLTALGLLVIGQRDRRPALLWWSAGLAAASAAYKVQVAAPAAVLFGLLVFLLWRPVPAWRRPVLFGVLAAGALGLMVAWERVPLAPHFFTGSYSAGGFFDLVHGLAPPPGAQLYATLVAGASPLAKRAIGATMLLVAAFGALLPVWLALVLAGGRRERWAPVRLIPLLLVGAYLLVLFGVPTAGYDDVSEFRHRPFVLVYAVLVVGVAAEVVGLWLDRRPWPRGGRIAAAVGGVALALACLRQDWQLSGNLQQSTVPANAKFASTPVPPGLLAAARYVRTHAARTDCVLSSDLDDWGLVLALTERPAFISFATQQQALRGDFHAVVQGRLAAARQLLQARTYEEISAMAAAHGIDWVVLRDRSAVPAWSDAILAKSAFHADPVWVFRFNRANPEGGR